VRRDQKNDGSDEKETLVLRIKEERAEGSRMRLMGLKNDKRTLELEYRTRFGPRDQLSPLKMMSYEATPILSQVEKVSASSICSDHRDLSTSSLLKEVLWR
jgi:hypothetical protein